MVQLIRLSISQAHVLAPVILEVRQILVGEMGVSVGA